MSEPSTEVISFQHPQAGYVELPLSPTARQVYSQGLVMMLLGSSIPANAPVALIHAVLEQSARLDLDLVAKEMWLADMRGTLTLLVGRDGYMKIAKRDPGFIACSGQAVYENDVFRAIHADDDTGWVIHHEVGNVATRGRLLGAWARLKRKDKPTEYFFAAWEQFGKDKNAWKDYKDAMIVKCAISYLLRTTYGVSGPAPADELAAGFIGPDGTVSNERPAAPELPEALGSLVDRAFAIDPNAWSPAEVLGRLPQTGADGYDDAVAAVGAELAAWLAEREPQDAEVVHDAQIVPDAPTTPQPQPTATVAAQQPVMRGPEDLQVRYQQDREWREKVGPLLHRQSDLEFAAEEQQTEQHAAEITAELDAVNAQLHELGVPPGWMPASPAQQTLAV